MNSLSFRLWCFALLFLVSAFFVPAFPMLKTSYTGIEMMRWISYNWQEMMGTGELKEPVAVLWTLVLAVVILSSVLYLSNRMPKGVTRWFLLAVQVLLYGAACVMHVLGFVMDMASKQMNAFLLVIIGLILLVAAQAVKWKSKPMKAVMSDEG